MHKKIDNARCKLISVYPKIKQRPTLAWIPTLGKRLNTTMG